jgi:hypothetical protein
MRISVVYSMAVLVTAAPQAAPMPLLLPPVPSFPALVLMDVDTV